MPIRAFFRNLLGARQRFTAAPFRRRKAAKQAVCLAALLSTLPMFFGNEFFRSGLYDRLLHGLVFHHGGAGDRQGAVVERSLHLYMVPGMVFDHLGIGNRYHLLVLVGDEHHLFAGIEALLGAVGFYVRSALLIAYPACPRALFSGR